MAVCFHRDEWLFHFPFFSVLSDTTKLMRLNSKTSAVNGVLFICGHGKEMRGGLTGTTFILRYLFCWLQSNWISCCEDDQCYLHYWAYRQLPPRCCPLNIFFITLSACSDRVPIGDIVPFEAVLFQQINSLAVKWTLCLTTKECSRLEFLCY